jgi:hypothetical protein
MNDLVDPQIVTLGAAGVLLTIIVRTLLRQENGWQSVLTAARQDAADARADAALARADAAIARAAEGECRRRLNALEARIRELEDRTPPNGNPKGAT